MFAIWCSSIGKWLVLAAGDAAGRQTYLEVSNAPLVLLFVDRVYRLRIFRTRLFCHHYPLSYSSCFAANAFARCID